MFLFAFIGWLILREGGRVGGGGGSGSHEGFFAVRDRGERGRQLPLAIFLSSI